MLCNHKARHKMPGSLSLQAVNSYPCRQCPRSFKVGQGLADHMRTSHGLSLGQYACRHCQRHFSTQEALADHLRSSHAQSQQVVYKCERCACSFKTQEALTAHNSTSHSRFYCPQCPCSFPTKEGLADHCLAKHSLKPQQPKMIACPDCSSKFSTREALEQHRHNSPGHGRLSVHAQPRSWPGQRQCSVCKKYFNDLLSLEQHHVHAHPVRLLDARGAEYQKLNRDFSGTWKSRDIPPGRIQSIFRVPIKASAEERFERYRRKVKDKASRTHGDALCLKDGNERMRYHGTTLACSLGIASSSTLCNLGTCHLCNILKGGFKLKKAAGFLRFGRGIYCTATSSKAHGYSLVSEQTSSPHLRAVLVCKVIAGRTHKFYDDMPHLTQAPEGYDSVVGEPGETLNYDELVLYNNRAILPVYVVVYGY